MKKVSKIVILLVMSLTLSGCFNYKEINDYAIVSGISIDIDEKDKNNYDVGVQIMNAKKDKESDNSLITVYNSKGSTIYQALEKIMLDSPKELYLGHNEVVVIGEELLRQKNPLEYLDYFMRDSEAEKKSVIMVAKDEKAYNILKIITPLETIPSKNLRATLGVSDSFSGTLTTITIDEFVSDISNQYVEPIIPSVEISGKVKKGESMDNISKSDPDTKLKYNTLGYFKNNKLAGYLTDDESVGYNFLAKVPKQTYVNVKCDDSNYATIRITNSDIKEKIFYENKVPTVKVNANISADILEYNCKADFIKNGKKLDELEKDSENKINKLMKKAINKLYVEEKSDVLKYREKFNARKYNETKLYKYSKNDILNKLKFKINTNVKIKSTELSIKSIRKETNNE